MPQTDLLADDVDKSWSNWYPRSMQIMEDCIPRASFRTQKSSLAIDNIKALSESKSVIPPLIHEGATADTAPHPSPL